MNIEKADNMILNQVSAFFNLTSNIVLEPWNKSTGINQQ